MSEEVETGIDKEKEKSREALLKELLYKPGTLTAVSYTPLLSEIADISINKLPALLKRLRNEFVDESAKDIIEKYKKKKNKRNVDIIEGAGISRDYFYAVLREVRRPSRDRVIQICFGLELNPNESSDFLKKMGHNELYARSERDAIIIALLSKGYNIYDADEVLLELGYDGFLLN